MRVSFTRSASFKTREALKAPYMQGRLFMKNKITEPEETLRDGIAMLPEMVDMAAELPIEMTLRSGRGPSAPSAPVLKTSGRSVSDTLTLNSTTDGENTLEESVRSRRAAPLHTPTGLGVEAVKEISAAGGSLLADVFALYLKTKNFHWHMSGAHFREYHLLLDDDGDELFAMTDPLAERIRKIGGSALKSVGDIAKRQRIKDNDADFVHPHEMLAELREDNISLVASLRSFHDLCDERGDVATASVLENWIDEGEKRIWFLYEITRDTNF